MITRPGVRVLLTVSVLTLVSCEAPVHWTDALIEYTKAWGAHKVTLLSSLHPKDSLKNPQLEETVRKLTEKYPIVRLNVADPANPDIPVPDDEIMEDSGVDTSRTLYVLIHETRDPLNDQRLELMISLLRNMSVFGWQPKCLLVLSTQSINTDLKEIMEFGWSKGILDLTIVQFVQPPRSKDNSLGPNNPDVTPVVHEFNPYKKEYQSGNWKLGTRWFKDKGHDMFGHTLKIALRDVPPFLLVEFNSKDEPIKVGGANILLLEAVANKLNFTVHYLPNIGTDEGLKNSISPEYVGDLMLSGKVDLFPNLIPLQLSSLKLISMRTTTIKRDKLCAVVPILPEGKLTISVNLEAYALSLSIVLIFWLVRHAFGFESGRWRFFKIVQVLVGVPGGYARPSRISERAMYFCLLGVSAIVSSSLYEAFTDVSLKTDSEKRFDSFEDLDNSGLRLVIRKFLFDKTFHENQGGPLTNLKRKAYQVTADNETCFGTLIRERNVACLMRESEMNVAVRRYKRLGSARSKVAEPCFWSDNDGFLLGKGSSFRSYVDYAVDRMQDAGVTERMYEDQKSFDSRLLKDELRSAFGESQNRGAMRRELTSVAFLGYSLSLVAFLGEIIVSRIPSSKWK